MKKTKTEYIKAEYIIVVPYNNKYVGVKVNEEDYKKYKCLANYTSLFEDGCWQGGVARSIKNLIEDTNQNVEYKDLRGDVLFFTKDSSYEDIKTELLKLPS